MTDPPAKEAANPARKPEGRCTGQSQWQGAAQSGISHTPTWIKGVPRVNILESSMKAAFRSSSPHPTHFVTHDVPDGDVRYWIERGKSKDKIICRLLWETNSRIRTIHAPTIQVKTQKVRISSSNSMLQLRDPQCGTYFWLSSIICWSNL